MTSLSGIELADRLNADCHCVSLDSARLAAELERVSPGFHDEVMAGRPHLFAASAAFVSAEHVRRMARLVGAVERVVALPAYREHVLAYAPEVARHRTAARGVFLGYDFHLGSGLGNSGPQLIEINTNAGGAMLNALLARAQRACCEAMAGLLPTPASILAFEQRVVDMFREEWRLAGREGPLATIAIIDEHPEQQYLYPEFLLFTHLFLRHGLRAVIAGPGDFEWREGRLWHGERAIDLIYNRLTDFYLEQPASALVREAWLQQAVVLTPDPRAHALYADKRRLAIFSDRAQLQALGVPEPVQQVLLDSVPLTETVDAAHADRLWAARRGLFFKPVAGYGSRAAYRGDKLTRRVWDEILAGDYVAQALVVPGERLIEGQDAPVPLKFDLRAYAYAGDVQWVAARLYQGQTTNFRTPGGGFAPVYSTVDAAASIAA